MNGYVIPHSSLLTSEGTLPLSVTYVSAQDQDRVERRPITLLVHLDIEGKRSIRNRFQRGKRFLRNEDDERG